MNDVGESPVSSIMTSTSTTSDNSTMSHLLTASAPIPGEVSILYTLRRI